MVERTLVKSGISSTYLKKKKNGRFFALSKRGNSLFAV